MSLSAIASIERGTLIRAPRERVWRAITTVAEFSKWFGVNAREGEFAPGATVRMVSTHPGEYEGVAFHVEVVEMTPPHTFSWHWHPGAPDTTVDYAKEPKTLVTFTLTDAEGGTLVTVTESGFDRISVERRAKLLEQNTAGWDYQMNSLTAYVG